MSRKQHKTGADAQADQPDAARRKFVRSAGLGLGAAGAAAVYFGRGGSDEAQAAQPEKAGGQGKTQAGYQETDHVRRYYQLARF
ncbi:hypothetical protein [Rhodovibrio salinarum]|uniref:Formate dehydrogenase region TAT target n=1 Tax=Rhodovibrio salinarum TaxID=1087 RepID=A0A934QJM7_9PROT|nr:hypothetical protein [Rhodovibrio salinarum]MBK1698333.1 hypothetical protein [Rhodovibrio salinarum]